MGVGVALEDTTALNKGPMMYIPWLELVHIQFPAHHFLVSASRREWIKIINSSKTFDKKLITYILYETRVRVRNLQMPKKK